MSLPCSVQDESPQPSLVIRARTSVENLPRLLGESYGRIAGHLAALGEAPAGPPFAAFHNADMQDLDVEIGFPVVKPLPGDAGIEAGLIPGGRMARCVYTGPYAGVASAYRDLGAWIEQHGYQATGVSYEMYLNDPATTPPQALQTLILMPLK